MSISKSTPNEQRTSMVPDRNKNGHSWDVEYIYTTYVHYKSALAKAEHLLARDVKIETKRQRGIEVEMPSDYMPTDERKKKIESLRNITTDWALNLKDLLLKTGTLAPEIDAKRKTELLEAVHEYQIPPRGIIFYR